MYYCHECKTHFKEVAKIIEKHGLSSPPYETVCVCPNCKGQNFEKEKSKYCRCCGAKLTSAQKEFCSSGCQNKGEKLFKKEKNHKQQQLESPIYSAVRQVDAYNKAHNTRLSYGRFFATAKNSQKGAKKNG